MKLAKELQELRLSGATRPGAAAAISATEPVDRCASRQDYHTSLEQLAQEFLSLADQEADKRNGCGANWQAGKWRGRADGLEYAASRIEFILNARRLAS